MLVKGATGISIRILYCGQWGTVFGAWWMDTMCVIKIQHSHLHLQLEYRAQIKRYSFREPYHISVIDNTMNNVFTWYNRHVCVACRLLRPKAKRYSYMFDGIKINAKIWHLSKHRRCFYGFQCNSSAVCESFKGFLCDLQTAWRLVLSMKPWSYIWLEFGLFNNYSTHPRMCVLSTLCCNVDKHSPLYIYKYISTTKLLKYLCVKYRKILQNHIFCLKACTMLNE